MIRLWTEYKGEPVSNDPTRLRVWLNARCVFTLNRAAHERMGSPEAVTLLYDERYRVIGLRPADPSRNNAFPFKPRYPNRKDGAGSGYMSIYATSFCKLHNLRPEQTVFFKNPPYENGVLELDLQKAKERNS